MQRAPQRKSHDALREAERDLPTQETGEASSREAGSKTKRGERDGEAPPPQTRKGRQQQTAGPNTKACANRPGLAYPGSRLQGQRRVLPEACCQSWFLLGLGRFGESVWVFPNRW